MQIQRTTDYAIQMLIYLTTKQGVVTSSELSEHLNISQKYVYDIGRKLKEANHVNTVLGSVGGYTIKAGEEVSLYDIVLLFEGTRRVDSSLDKRKGQAYGIDAANSYYSELQKQVKESLKSKTLATLQYS